MTLLDLQTRRLSMDRGVNSRASLRALLGPHVGAPPARPDRPLVDLIDDALSLLEDHPLQRQAQVQARARRNHPNRRRGNNHPADEAADDLPTN